MYGMWIIVFFYLNMNTNLEQNYNSWCFLSSKEFHMFLTNLDFSWNILFKDYSIETIVFITLIVKVLHASRIKNKLLTNFKKATE